LDKKKRRVRCVGCSQLFDREDIEFSPDPYAEEINGDNTPVWECEDCRHESCMDI